MFSLDGGFKLPETEGVSALEIIAARVVSEFGVPSRLRFPETAAGDDVVVFGTIGVVFAESEELDDTRRASDEEEVAAGETVSELCCATGAGCNEGV